MTMRRMRPLEIVVGVLILVLFVLLGVVIAYSLVCSNATTISTKLVEGIPAGIVALIVAGVASLIAYNQYRVARAKLNLDLFERRLPIFITTRDFIKSAAAKDEWSEKALATLKEAIPEASFLFGHEIEEYLLRIISMSEGLHRSHIAIELATSGVPEDESWKALLPIDQGLLDEVHRHQSWFANELECCRTRFSPYLGFGEWH